MRQLGPEIVIATRNAGKVKEFEPMFRSQGIALKSLRDFEDMPDIVEDGDTFAANALIKARTIALRLGVPVLADDSGLCVDKLDGAPGVYSARYAGEHASDEANNRKLLDQLKKQAADSNGSDNEQGMLSPARFVAALCLVDAQGEPIAEAEGACPGWIIAEARGDQGFGYDPLFYIPAFHKTMGELTVQEKNEISHRGLAIRALWDKLQQD
ncbi:RdgB/HAM1 family non-canonical purine NTP pyrophosphatase [Paenibacillus rigui]|uniref:dITP/XTP pyrophosphatase n=1 Tax=Paenibacillus rigui TaxID=554312 RepID=A0A229UU39_9BACL|nr:RdgB/HAM1 family non-canonical purine NTP pyrophosphatase [Paenibacillus rigui]OXM86894.1 non-canonical purine NTP pyrophosphatase, RdgB/HAM1 family [Paenibacillus rigui]